MELIKKLIIGGLVLLLLVVVLVVLLSNNNNTNNNTNNSGPSYQVSGDDELRKYQLDAMRLQALNNEYDNTYTGGRDDIDYANLNVDGGVVLDKSFADNLKLEGFQHRRHRRMC